MSTLPGTHGAEAPVAGTPRRLAGRPGGGAVGIRRFRGGVLRLARRRAVGVAAGSALLLPSVALAAADYPWEGWFTDGLGLVALATGAALVVAALGGRRPDWVEPARPAAEPRDAPPRGGRRRTPDEERPPDEA